MGGLLCNVVQGFGMPTAAQMTWRFVVFISTVILGKGDLFKHMDPS
tara:strand:+ start:15018 stop:15155 length:138 start_codon:yes stop_codon:yes gene_type:complete